MDKTETLADCPFCGGAMMFRKALWPSDGCTDAVIHAEPTDCGMAAFDTGKTDESVITTWNTRTPRPDSALADEGEYDCPNCHGEGEIYRYNASDPASPTVHCENCNGTGRAAGLADKLERLLKWHRWDDARLAHWLRGAGDRILAALRTRKSEALADDAVEQVLAHVAGGGPHEWGYRDPVTGEFIADDWPFRAADALAALRSTPPEADLRAENDVCHGLDTPERVCFYEQDFYVLSNFSAFRLLWKGLTFDTLEAAYHWEKFPEDFGLQTRIRTAPSAHEAFKIAGEFRDRRRANWDAVKVDIMRELLFAKVAQHEYVRRKLLSTGNRELVENSWRDDFWGWGPNRDGQNMLGRLWMEVRAALTKGADHD